MTTYARALHAKERELHAAWKLFTRFCAAARVDTTDGSWLMFRAGWEALEAKLRSEATDWWCDNG